MKPVDAPVGWTDSRGGGLLSGSGCRQPSAAAPAASACPASSWADEGDAGPIDCGPPPTAKPQHQTGGESFPPLPLPATPLRRSEKKRPPSPPALVGKVALGATRWITKDGKRVQYRDWMTDPADVMTLLELDGREAGDQLSGDRGRLRPFLLRSPRAAGVALGRAQQVRADRRGPPEAGPLRDGRRHDHRRRLLRLERFRRVVPPRDRADLPRPAAAEDAARGAGLLVVLQAGQPDATRRATARPSSSRPAWKGSTSAAARA